MTQNTYAKCSDCRHYREMQCRNPVSPYGGKVRLPAHGCWAASKVRND